MVRSESGLVQDDRGLGGNFRLFYDQFSFVLCGETLSGKPTFYLSLGDLPYFRDAKLSS